MKRTVLLLACAACVASAHAHQLWLNATKYHIDNPVGSDGSIDAGVVYIGWGHQFPAEGLPEADKVAPTVLHAPDGTSEALQRSDAGFLTAPLSVTSEGAYTVTSAYESGFFTMYRDDGEVKHALSPKEGMADVISSQYFEMCGKALVQVGEPGEGDFASATGQPIEIVPLRNPYTMTAGPEAELPVRVLLRGEPVSEAFVTVYHAAHVPGSEFVAKTETDSDGEASVSLDRSGAWMIVANARTPLRPEFEGKADEESYTATLTFQVR